MALSGKYTTVERVLERVHSDYGLQFHIPFGDALEWIGDAIDLIGVIYSYEKKISDPIVISDYKGTLPCDVHQVEQVRMTDTKEYLVESTATFHKAHDENYDTKDNYSFNDYIIEGNYIKTNFEEGEVEVAYLAFPTDDRGYPKIPEDTRYIRAVIASVAEKIAFRQLGANAISERFYERINQKKSFYFKGAVSYSHQLSIDQAESMKNYMQRLVKHPNMHGSGFKYFNTSEKLNF